MIWGEGGDVFIVDGLENIKLLCGACKHWTKGNHRASDGRLYGYCNKQNIETERCSWCNMSKEGKNDKTA